ncbi:MAG: PBP1A family penicillin-binding protein [Treponema sp.]|nr:PBP1A family penicillin-binding protein [Treponema sp.]
MKSKIAPKVFLYLLTFFALLFGILLGTGLSRTAYTINTENYTVFKEALPTKILDVNGELLTEFSSEEKREIITMNELPQHMHDALITREDRVFYEHRGFNTAAIFRAVVGQVLHISLGGGSTLTQQIAGTLYCDRREMSIKRKLKELWWAIQMERRYSKTEILETYLNKIYFGGGSYGVNTASKYYFNHSAHTLNPAECAMLVIQLSNPAFYNPFEHPSRAMERQKDVLASMVKEGYITQQEADTSYDNYWISFDFTRTDTSAFFMREDKAPWFSEMVRRELTELIYGDADIYSEGYTVNTTCNLVHQQIATDLMEKAIKGANDAYRIERIYQQRYAMGTYVPMSNFFILLCGLRDLRITWNQVKKKSVKRFINNYTPVIDIMSVMTGLDSIKVEITTASQKVMMKNKASVVEGTMVNIENDTGFITAVVGGSKFDSSNQFIRATQARIQPGSSIKPLYYSAALDTKRITAGSSILDAPYEFIAQDGQQYLPNNYGGAWRGYVNTTKALALSLNIPALKVLQAAGFDNAIAHMVKLLGISDKELPSRAFIPGYPIGLGTCAVRPIEMARAYAIFANGGKKIETTAIRNVEDRNGNIILNPEHTARENLLHPTQLISRENAFIMEQMMEDSVKYGTLKYGSELRSRDPNLKGSKFTFVDKTTGKTYNMPVSGKTGTTQNWGDAWAVGFTPYYTAAFWFGFDTPGKSMGMQATGSSLAGPPWGDFMAAIHEDLPYKEFPGPTDNLVKATSCAESGGIPLRGCPVATSWYMRGTTPKYYCHLHGDTAYRGQKILDERIQDQMASSGYTIDAVISDDSEIEVDLSFLEDNASSGEKKEKQNSFME